MGQKDILERNLLEKKDVYADIRNVFAFHGKRVIDPNDLYLSSRNGIISIDGKIHENIRDAEMEWRKGKRLLAYLGVENETEKDNRMPLRMQDYDAAQIRKQLLNRRNKAVPVASMVLNFSRTRWTKPRSTFECITFPKGTMDCLAPYVSNHHIMVHDIAYLDEKTLSLFQSDFGSLAEYFTKSGLNIKYEPDKLNLDHPELFLTLLSVLTGDPRYRNDIGSEENGGTPDSMCKVLDYHEQLGEKRGRKIGKIEGKRIGKIEGERRGRKLEHEQSLLKYTEALIRTQHISAEEAMTMLDVPENERKLIRLKLAL